jgi:hypothetical protein
LYIAITIAKTVVFVLIIDSYWPMLFKIYETVDNMHMDLKKKILKKEKDIKKKQFKKVQME